MLLRLFMSIWFVITANPVAAYDPTLVAENAVAQWQGWMEKHGIPQGAIIIAYDGIVVGAGGINRSVDDPAKVASLSKAITAICALKAAESAGKNPQTPLIEAIPATLATHVPQDDRFADITIGQLITHTSGIASDFHRVELPKLRTFSEENKLWQFSKVALERMTDPPGQAPYRYSNANYLVLGLVIEELSGEGYEEYCRREVLAPAGVTTGRLNDDWRVMSAWGGWDMSARDYLAFAQLNFSGEHDPERPGGYDLQVADLGQGRAYSAGMIFRRTDVGPISWHQGAWTGVPGRLEEPFGAYVALYETGFSVVTNYADAAWEADVARELDSLLFNAMHP